MAASPFPFVEKTFQTPVKLETSEFRLRMLTINDAVKDFDAVMSSVDQLKDVWPGSGWPNGLTIEQNIVDLGWHQREFQSRRSFAYTVVSLDEAQVLGCVYVEPTRKREYDAEVYLWVRECEPGTGLDSQLFEAVRRWLAQEWPFASVAFPGRGVDWETWNSLPDEKR